MTDRYIVINKSQSGHCCFTHTIVDTTQPDIVNGQHYRDSDGALWYLTVCECFEEADAQLIAKALNASQENATA